MLKWLQNHESKGSVGITCGAFDLLHAGHITMLAEAKNKCDYLVVALQSDPTMDRPEKNKPIQSIVERQLQVAAVRYVDDVIIYNTEEELKDIFLSLPIDVRIIGSDYLNKDFTAKDICEERDIRIVYNSRDHSFSSTSLRNRIAKG